MLRLFLLKGVLFISELKVTISKVGIVDLDQAASFTVLRGILHLPLRW